MYVRKIDHPGAWEPYHSTRLNGRYKLLHIWQPHLLILISMSQILFPNVKNVVFLPMTVTNSYRPGNPRDLLFGNPYCSHGNTITQPHIIE